MPKQDAIETNESMVTEQTNGEETSNIETTENQEETSNQESTQNKDNKSNEEENQEESKEEIKDESFETAKDSSGGKFDTLTLVQEVAKIEAKIETAKSKTVNEADFYKNLKEYLTDEQMQLRFEDDQTKYIDAVNTAKQKWLKENSVDTTEQEVMLEKVRGALTISKAIDSVLKDPAYKDFNFVKLQDFYHNDLTKKEQTALDKGSSKDNLADYFKKIHDEYKKRNPKIVKNVEAPNIPDASKASRTAVEDANEIKKEQDQKKYMEKIGFRKL